MRCVECNVDLGEEYTICPLCGAAAVNEKARFEGFKTAEYPPVFQKAIKKRKKPFELKLSAERLKAYFDI